MLIITEFFLSGCWNLHFKVARPMKWLELEICSDGVWTKTGISTFILSQILCKTLICAFQLKERQNSPPKGLNLLCVLHLHLRDEPKRREKQISTSCIALNPLLDKLHSFLIVVRELSTLINGILWVQIKKPMLCWLRMHPVVSYFRHKTWDSHLSLQLQAKMQTLKRLNAVL